MELLTRAIKGVENFGIPALLDPEDIANSLIDDRSMITYLSFYPAFIKSSKRLRNDISEYKKEMQEKKKRAKELRLNTSSQPPSNEGSENEEMQTTNESLNVSEPLLNISEPPSCDGSETEEVNAEIQSLEKQLKQKVKIKVSYLIV